MPKLLGLFALPPAKAGRRRGASRGSQHRQPKSSRVNKPVLERRLRGGSAGLRGGGALVALLEHIALQQFLDPDETEGRETFLSSCNEWSDETKRFGQDLPLRLAEAVRNLLAAAMTG